MIFLHNGALGDIIYSLPTVIAFGGGDYYFEKENQYEILRSLLDLQPCINSTHHYKRGVNIDVDMRKYRKERDYNKHLTKWCLDPFNKEFDLSQIWLHNIEETYVAEIIVCRTKRYHDVEDIDYSILKDYKSVLFIGYEGDRDRLNNKYDLNLPFYWCKDGLEYAQIIKGSKLFIGNQSFGFCLAEALKHPRILEHYAAKNNNQPLSDNGHTYINKELIDSYL